LGGKSLLDNLLTVLNVQWIKTKQIAHETIAQTVKERQNFRLRFEKGRWLPSRILNADKWEINACPVNGAAASARNSRVE
jgi:hypothetical protein